MERNWLIRTTQKQILGPVTKSKVLEFFQKGALGLNDEVTSGNGYWFSLKEKELVDKYLLGDVPQGFNPISESKSILSKRENPNKTTSLNTAPANKSPVLKAGSMDPGVIPSNNDLEYPDITVVHTLNATELRLPTSEDLEFPDISLIKASINNSPAAEIHSASQVGMKSPSADNIETIASEGPVVYPEGDDLAYPDLNLNTQLEEVKKLPSEDFHNEFEHDSGLTLLHTAAPSEQKPEKVGPILRQDKKLLHERKLKASLQSFIPPEVIKDPPKDHARSALPEHLEKRNDNYLMYVLVILVLIILSLFFYYYRTILNKPLPV